VDLCGAGGEVAEPVEDTACVQEEGGTASAGSVGRELCVDLVQNSEDEQCADGGYEAAHKQCDKCWYRT